MNRGLFGFKNQISEVYVTGGNPNGDYASVGGLVRCFQTLSKSTGSAITYVSDLTLGDRFIINEPGVYAITYYEVNGSSTLMSPGITANSQSLSNAVAAEPYLITGFMGILASAGNGLLSTVCSLNAGDVLRVQEFGANNGASSTAPIVSIRIVKVSSGA